MNKPLVDLNKSELIDLINMYGDLLGIGPDGKVYHNRNEVSSIPMTVITGINKNEALITEPLGNVSSSVFTLNTRYKSGSFTIYSDVVISDEFCMELWNNNIVIIHPGQVSPYDREKITMRVNRIDTIRNIINNLS